jgi:hypothetical protein
MKKYMLLFIIGMLLFSSTIPASVSFDGPTPPDQPTSGPGSNDYSHNGYEKSRYKWGARQYWIFEPTDPKPESAPLIVFNHGYLAIHPIIYWSWIIHLVKRGNIVVYPRYQVGIILGYNRFLTNAIDAVKDSIKTLQSGNHVKPELDKFAIVGHSLGGGITANMAALAEENGLPIPKAIMPVQPFLQPGILADLSKIHTDTLMLVVVGEDDDVVGNTSAKIIFENTPQISFLRKDFVIQITDDYGSPGLLADHIAPLCLPDIFSYSTDAMDYYSTWKLFDALTDFAFYGTNEEYCLGNTPEQVNMGEWSDGTPVKKLIVTDNP